MGLARCLCGHRNRWSSNKGETGDKTEAVHLLRSRYAGTQGTEGTIVPRAAFFEALETLDIWAYIVASDALAPLSDVGYLRLNESGVAQLPHRIVCASTALLNLRRESVLLRALRTARGVLR